MKKIILAALLLAALPWGAAAQVEKQVEVTKAYVPSVGSAEKLRIEPDMTDTVKLRPEIDYTVTPLSLRTTLATRPFRPATVTYWEFNRPLPCYLKVGAGYPLNSVVDFYASSQNPSTGYVMGYLNHEGRYADVRNDFGVSNDSWWMTNRIGAAAGKYLGRHMLEGDLFYDHRIYHRYGLYADPALVPALKPGARVMYGDAAVNLRFGDDFEDLSRLNFEIALHGDLYSGAPDMYEVGFEQTADGFDAAYRNVEKSMRQTSLGGSLRLARAFGRHRIELGGGYDYLAGQKLLRDLRQQQLRVGLRYGLRGGAVRLDVGADYYHDRVQTDATETGDYVIPYLRLDFNLGTAGLKPFVELDGDVRANDFRSLSQQNPYLADALWLGRSSVDYNGRFGIGGSLWRNRFAYRLYAAVSVRDNHPYWYSLTEVWGTAEEPKAGGGPFMAALARQTVTSLNFEAEYRPVSQLSLRAGVHARAYNDESRGSYAFSPDPRLKLDNGAPRFEGNIGFRYEGRKVSFGVEALMQSERSWTSVVICRDPFPAAGGEETFTSVISSFTAPFAVDLRVTFDWKISHRVTLFAEGRNLINRSLYRFAWYPEYGANCTAGVKINF